MKLRWYDRVLVGLAGVVLVALGVIVALSAGGLVTLPEPFAIDVWIGDGWQWVPVVFLIGVLVCLWGCWLVALSVSVRQSAAGRYYTVQGGEDESLRISVQALEHLIRKVVDARPEILSAQIRLGGQERAARVTLRASVRSDVRIPGLVRELRDEIRSYVEDCAGVSVENVQVIVDATKDGAEPRKDAKPGSPWLPPPKEKKPEKLPEPVEVKAEPPVQAIIYSQPAEMPEIMAEPDAEADDGPEPAPVEPLPVTLSASAFPFPDTDAEEERTDA